MLTVLVICLPRVLSVTASPPGLSSTDLSKCSAEEDIRGAQVVDVIMKIACLQFAPQVGDIDNNLNRADSVLAKANPEDLEALDLLVLPELAFTGTRP